VNPNIATSKLDVMNSNIGEQLWQQNQLPGERCQRREGIMHREGPKKLLEGTLKVVKKYHGPKDCKPKSPKNLFLAMLEENINSTEMPSPRTTTLRGGSSMSPAMRSSGKQQTPLRATTRRSSGARGDEAPSQVLKSSLQASAGAELQLEPVAQHPHEKMFKPQVYKPTRLS